MAAVGTGLTACGPPLIQMRQDDKALGWIATQHDAMCGRVESWASIASGSRTIGGLVRMADETRRVLEDLGAQVEIVAVPPEPVVDADGRVVEQELGPVVIATRHADAERRVLLACHLDTVFAADDPFQSVTRGEDGSLHGPGVTDAKGGIAIMLTALEALERDPLAGRLGWTVILNSDEEVGSPGSAALLRSHAPGHAAGLVYEPALEGGDLVSARKGSGNFAVVVRGVRAHAGREPEKGRNAVVAAAALAAELDRMGRRENGVTVNVARIEGGSAYNVVPDLAIVRFNARVTNEAELREVESFLAQQLTAANEDRAGDGIHFELHGEFRAPPRPITTAMKRLMDEVDACASELAIAFGWRPTGGVCDGNRLSAAGLPTVDTLGARGTGIHSTRERLIAESLTERAMLSALLLRRFADGRFDSERHGSDE